MEKTNWIRKLALADLKGSKLRSIMTIFSVVMITTLVSSCATVYASLLLSTDKMIRGNVNFSIGFYIFLIIPVLICGLLLIIDCFHLDRQNSINQNGLLTSVGLTKTQNRSILRWQTFYLTAPGFIIGIVLTLIFIYLIMPTFAGSMYTDFETVGLVVVLIILVCTGIVVMGIVNAGLYISYYESEQMSVSERIRYGGHLAYSTKTIISAHISKRENTERYPGKILSRTSLAFKNYIRIIKNNIHVPLSLILALTTLLAVSVIINGINPNALADVYVGKSDYKLSNVTFSDDYVEVGSAEDLFAAGAKPQVKSPSVQIFEEEFVGELEKNEDIKSLKITKHLYMSYDEEYDDTAYNEIEYYLDNFFVVDTDYILERFSQGKELGKDIIDKFEKGEIVFFPGEDDRSRYEGFTINGSVIREGVSGTSFGESMKKNKFSFSVYGIPDEIAAGNTYLYQGWYIHENCLDEFDIKPIISSIEFSADAEDRPRLQKWVDEKISNDPLIESESRDRYKALVQREKDATFLVGYLLTAILVAISFIGFVIVNTISVDARKKEFLLLNSIGMSRRDIKFMLLTEGAIYGVAIIIVMMFIANPMIWLIYSNFKVFYSTYHFPAVLSATSMVITFLITLIVPVIIYNRQVQKR